jgi:hypothetical protein
MSKTLWIRPTFSLQDTVSRTVAKGHGDARRLCYTRRPMTMDSFLDRLLSDAAAGTRPQAASEPAGDGSRPAPVPVRDAAADRAVPIAAPTPSNPAPRFAGAPSAEAAPGGPAAPRIAVYDTLTSPPRVVSVERDAFPALMDALATETYRACREQGGQVPYIVIRELIENLIHASFCDVVVTVLEGGQVIRISDHGPGIADKERAVEVGFTTAGEEQRRYIRGVGSGLPVARESLAFMQGVLEIDDNLGGGTVLTINLPSGPATPAPPPTPVAAPPKLTNRQKRVLFLLMELGAAGPTAVGRELDVAAATAFRELGVLENMGLIHSRGDGKRALTSEGVAVLDSIL